MTLDFYTITTKKQITSEMMPAIVQAMMIYSQPEIVGEPFIEKKMCILRFAIRVSAIRPYEDEFRARLSEIIDADVELVRASRL